MPIRRTVAVSHCLRTAAGALALGERLRASGWDVLSFEAGGVGGLALEAAIRAGRCDAVVEWSLTELAMEQLGQPTAAGRDRLTAAAAAGLPQVIVLGGLDAAEVTVGEPSRKTIEFAGRRFARVTPADADALGREIAFKLSACRGPVVVLLPRLGLSILDGPDQPLHDPIANAALVQSLRSWMSPAVLLRELDSAVDAPALVDAAFAALEEIR